MADKAISELVSAEQITATDMFVLEQNGTAKKLTGQVLLNWLTAAADGHGGIQNINKLGTSGLADTYRITLADTTVYDFVVTNGRGINSLQKVETSGLVDTYRFNYNDGTYGTFTVTNGEKGDKGNNAYIWVKYASQQPTASSNSFGDLPDNWMGVYFGTSSTAPTNWQSYQWYQIKGEKGDTGDPATLVSAQITYQVGDSGTIIPSGSWTTSVPTVTPGKFLWTRQVLQFNTGGPITSYSVSRFGIDGSGAVSTVAGVAPDENGNVPLDASSVKALPIAGGTMQGPINMNGQKLTGLNAPSANNEAATKGYVDTNKVDKANVVNNFTTEEEGFVADARTVKALNDNKLSMELVWENGSPTSEFGRGPIEFIGEFDAVDVEFKISTSINYRFIVRNIIGSHTNCVQDKNNGRLVTRYFGSSTTTTTEGIKTIISMNDAFFYGTYGADTKDNSVLIPTRVYGIKGVM